MTAGAAEPEQESKEGFIRGLGLLDSTMIVAGSMIGSGIFIVSADIARQTGSAGGLLLTWLITAILTVVAALSYGELAAMMPKAGGQYVYLRESYSPLWGFLYGWTLFLVIQTGTIAAVAVAFSRFLGFFFQSVSSTSYIIKPIHIGSSYALSLSTQQLVAVLLIVVLTLINLQGIKLGKLIQNVFTLTKTASLLALILLGIFIGGASGTFSKNWANLFTPQHAAPVTPDFFNSLSSLGISDGVLGFIVVICVVQVGSLFSSDAWNNITFTAGEVKDPKRNIPLSLALGTGLVLTLYILANIAYLSTMSLAQIQGAPEDRVGTGALEIILGGIGASVMAYAIIISTFGCNNGLILSGARVYYAMACDKLFFRSTGKLNKNHVPGFALVLQCIWACLLVLPRTITTDAKTNAVSYGNLYGTLLDYVVFAVLIFYILTIAGIFVLRKKKPDAERPYKAFGYPVLPALYIVAATIICIVLLLYKTKTSWPGLAIVLTGVPVYFIWRNMSDGGDGDGSTETSEGFERGNGLVGDGETEAVEHERNNGLVEEPEEEIIDTAGDEGQDGPEADDERSIHS